MQLYRKTSVMTELQWDLMPIKTLKGESDEHRRTRHSKESVMDRHKEDSACHREAY